MAGPRKSRGAAKGASAESGAAQRSARSASLEEPEGAATTTLDVDALRQIVEILEASDVTRLSWRRGRERLLIRRGQPTTIVHATPAGPAVTAVAPMSPASSDAQASRPSSAPSASQPQGAASGKGEAKAGHLVTSPFVGTFYRTPAPDQPAFVDVGAVVRKGQVLCIIEAMKLMNEIESDEAGKVTEVLAQNGEPVEFGQALFRIEGL